MRNIFKPKYLKRHNGTYYKDPFPMIVLGLIAFGVVLTAFVIWVVWLVGQVK